MTPSKTLLQEADAVISGPRAKDYGDAVTNHERIAGLWSAYLETPVTAGQVAICMALLKISRLAETPDHHDTHVDLAGYTAIHALIEDA